MQALPFFLDWEINCQFAGLIWARQKGFYDTAGLALDLVPPHVHPEETTLDLVRGHGLSLGCAEDNLVVMGALEGGDIRAVAAMLPTTPLALMSLPGSGIDTFADLAGRRVGVHADARRLLQALLSLHGLDPPAVEVTPESWSLDDLLEGRLDAVQGYVITERHGLERRGVIPRCLSLRHDLLAPCSQVIFARSESLNRDRALVKAFLGATFAGWRAVIDDPGEAGRMVADLSEEHADPNVNVEILRSMAPLLKGYEEEQPLGRLRPEQWRRNLISYARFGLIPNRGCYEEVVDDTLL